MKITMTHTMFQLKEKILNLYFMENNGMVCKYDRDNKCFMAIAWVNPNKLNHFLSDKEKQCFEREVEIPDENVELLMDNNYCNDYLMELGLMARPKQKLSKKNKDVMLLAMMAGVYAMNITSIDRENIETITGRRI